MNTHTETTTTQTRTALDWRGESVTDESGASIGTVKEIYVDETGGQPEWLLVKTGLLGGSQFVPVEGAYWKDGSVCIPYNKSVVKDAPSVNDDAAISTSEESALYEYYGLSSGVSGHSHTEVENTRSGYEGSNGSGSTGTSGEAWTGTNSGDTSDSAMTRSEEELRVGTERQAVGTARLKKYIVTENVTTTVPVQREEVRVEREPITEGNVDGALSGPELTESEHEVTLYAETPVVDKTVVPKERVRLDKETWTEEQKISEELRKEKIEIEGDGTSTRSSTDSTSW